MKLSGKKSKKQNIKEKKRKSFVVAPLEKLEDAVKILNTDEITTTRNRNMCRNTKRRATDVAHLSNLHYCNLIKCAILQHKWKDVLKLLLAYIDVPRSDKHTCGIIFKFTFIYLLNDPIAKRLNIMDEFLQLALSCQTQSQKTEFMKMIMSISEDSNQVKQPIK